MTHDELDTLREGWDFEAKLAVGADGRGALPDSFWETYSAMANSHGGRIALGVKELPDGSFDVRGLPDVERVERDLWNTLNNRQKVSVNLLSQGDVQRVAVGQLRVLVVTVPRAPRQDRPVFLANDLWGGTYLRVHEGDRRADRERVRLMVAESLPTSRDERVLPKFGLNDLSAETLREYRQAFRSLHEDHPWAAEPDDAFLRHVGAWGRDRETGAEGLTVAGLLMLGRFETICEVLPTYFVDYQERREGTGAIEWDDRVYPDGTWSGNIYDFFRRVVRKLKAELKVPFRLDADMVRRDETHAHEAIREALVNALIHADYEGRVSVLVLKRDSEFELRNPGDVRVTEEQLRLGGISDCRNRTVQRLFLLVGVGEQVGSGFSRIERAWAEMGWPRPAVEENAELYTTTVHLPFGPNPVGPDVERSPKNSEQTPASSEQTPASSEQTPASSEQILASSEQTRASGRRWAPRHEVIDAILWACRDEFLTLPQLAERLGRHASTLRTHYVRPLLRAGKLRMLHPDQPNHPAQAYGATGADKPAMRS